MGVDDIFTWNDQREAGSIIMPVCECKKVDFTFEICGHARLLRHQSNIDKLEYCWSSFLLFQVKIL